MEKQTKKQAIKKAVEKCPYKYVCKLIELSKEEKEWILDKIKIELDSYRLGGGKLKKERYDFSGEFSKEMDDIKILKSVFNKIRTSQNRRKEKQE